MILPTLKDFFFKKKCIHITVSNGVMWNGVKSVS